MIPTSRTPMTPTGAESMIVSGGEDEVGPDSPPPAGGEAVVVPDEPDPGVDCSGTGLCPAEGAGLPELPCRIASFSFLMQRRLALFCFSALPG